MYRNAIRTLEKWNNSARRKPMIVWGARQVGKTYLVRDIFAETYYRDNYLYIDFRLETDIRDYCEKHVSAKEIVELIAAVKNKRITEHTLLIFDEIQECPGIITALKYFCQDMREIPVIATGSMVRTRLQRLNRKRGVSKGEPFLFPVGNINQVTVFPMTFDEFLINSNRLLFDKICNAYSQKEPLPDAVHKLALNEVYRYLLVGGMPDAVQTFLDTGSYLESREVLTDLYDNYLSDMELYQASPEAIIRSGKIFRGIFAELNKESKNFKPGLIETGSKTRDMKTPIDWLTMAYVVHQSFRLDEHVTMPLTDKNDSDFRLYLGDIGMFIYQSGINSASFLSGDPNNTLSGIFFENYIANELTARGIGLYYWCGKRNSELEFIVESDGLLYPIDVKKNRGSLNSLEKFSHHNRFEAAIRVSSNNYGYNNGQKLLTVPFYMFFLVADDLSKGLRIVG
ncbi:MAG: ATP-binding protein [Clostridia bacterium]|nr:ATP-binding protein [Clostridia bacterium]